MPHPLVRLVSALPLVALAALPATAQVAPRLAGAVVPGPTIEFASSENRTAPPPAVSRQRPAGIGDLALLTLGGVGGGIAAAVVVSAADPDPALGAAAYGLGVGAGATLTGRLLRVDGSPLGAFIGAAAGSALVLLVADASDDDGEEGLSDAAEIALLALVVPPVLSTGGYVLTPTLLGSRSAGLALRVDF